MTPSRVFLFGLAGAIVLPELCAEPPLDALGFFAGTRPFHPLRTFAENAFAWAAVYMTWFAALYLIRPDRRLFGGVKFHPSEPAAPMVLTEAARSLRGVAIATVWEWVLAHAYSDWALLPLPVAAALPWSVAPLPADQARSLSVLAPWVVPLYLWGDMHFYWTHRLLHSPWLYRKVHKDHHQSFNPNPFSGLSMHPVESTVYFSAAPLLALFAPPHAAAAILKGLIFFPLPGHCGYGSWEREPEWNHYIHHVKFNWNYGSSPLWDWLMGTRYPYPVPPAQGAAAAEAEGARGEEAAAQAALVGTSLAGERRAASAAAKER